MDLKSYIKGKRHGKEANQLEREAMNDAFLQDAIDGYDSVPGEHFSAIEKLEQQLVSPPKRIDKRVWLWVAAAVLVLLIGIPFLLRQPQVKEVQMASSKAVKQEETAILSPERDSVLITDNVKPKAPQERAVIPAPAEVREEKLESREAFVAQEVAEDAVSKEIVTRQQENAVTAIEPAQVSVTKVIQPRQEAIQSRVAGISTVSNTKTISGKIVDEMGEPLIGATINMKDTRFGTVTDTAGNFKLNIPANTEDMLIASYVGYENKEIPLKKDIGNVVMKADTELLSEVVVVAFGTQKKESLVGSVSSVSKVKDSIPTFGETEFKQYFEENYDKTICENELISLKVEFYVNTQGQPGNIVIKENSCPALEIEIRRLLLGSPKWSQTNRKVTLNLTLNE